MGIVLEQLTTLLTVIISAAVSVLHHAFKTTCFNAGILSTSVKVLEE